MRFTVSTNQIHQNIHEMRQLSGELQYLLQRSAELFERSGDMIESSDAQQFVSAGLEQTNICRNLVDTLNNCADYWANISAAYEQGEESIANEIASKMFL